jgi:hypothetical protein
MRKTRNRTFAQSDPLMALADADQIPPRHAATRNAGYRLTIPSP